MVIPIVGMVESTVVWQRMECWSCYGMIDLHESIVAEDRTMSTQHQGVIFKIAAR